MKRVLLCGVALAFSATAALAGSPDDYGLYLRVLGGGTYTVPLNVGGNFYGMDPGWNLGATFGWNATDYFAIEGDYFRGTMQYAGAEPSNIVSNSLMIDMLVHYDDLQSVKFYGGLGFGGYYLNYTNSTVAGMASAPSGGQFSYGGQAKVGVAVPVAQSFSVVGEYRYQMAIDATGSTPTLGYNSHNVSVGVQYNF